MKTTKANFSTFKKWFIHYQKLYGLIDWDIYFEHASVKGVYADVTSSAMSRKATVRLATNWIGRDASDLELRFCALHECNHVLIHRLRWIGTCRYIGEEEIQEADEALVVRLTNIVSKLENISKIDETTSGRATRMPQKRLKKRKSS